MQRTSNQYLKLNTFWADYHLTTNFKGRSQKHRHCFPTAAFFRSETQISLVKPSHKHIANRSK